MHGFSLNRFAGFLCPKNASAEVGSGGSLAVLGRRVLTGLAAKVRF